MEFHIQGYEELTDGTKFPIYIPQLNSQDPWNHRIVAIFADDIIKYQGLTKRWYKRNYFQGSIRCCLLYLNHPLKRLRLCGLVLGCRWKVINQEEHVVWSLDDCSNCITCHCTKIQLRDTGKTVESLTGRRIFVTGVFDCDRAEFKVNEIEIVSTLIEEVAFWKSALRDRRALREFWIPDPDTIKRFYNESPSAEKVSEDFVADLNETHFRECELEITSPYTEYTPLNSDDSNPDDDNGDVISVVNQDLISHGTVDGELPDYRLHVPQSTTTQPISLKFLKKKLLTWLLLKSETAKLCEYHAPSQDPKIVFLLDELSKLQIQDKRLLADTETATSRKEKIYNSCLEELIKIDVIANNDGKLNLENLSICYRYIKTRLQSFINMHIPSCIIAYDQVRTICNLPLLSNVVILNSCKYFLDSSPMGDLLDWWVDPLSENTIKLHFIFK